MAIAGVDMVAGTVAVMDMAVVMACTAADTASTIGVMGVDIQDTVMGATAAATTVFLPPIAIA